MSGTVVVGLDGSRESQAAAAWAAHEAVLREVPLHLVHAWQPQPTASASFAGVSLSALHTDLRGWSARLLSETQAELTRRHPGLRVTTGQHAEQAVPVLLTAAEEADLLVLGSRGLHGVTGFLLGSVALTVVARSRRPVVLVRGGERAEDEDERPADARDVVIGLDLREPHEAVIAFAFEAAARRASGLRVVYGWNPPLTHSDHGAFTDAVEAELTGSMRGALHELLAPWEEKFPGVEVTTQAVIGKAGSHLVEASRDASLMVVGRTASHAPLGARIGPVAHAVLHHTATPVAVVPHD